jgi:predicted transcriptional regulator
VVAEKCIATLPHVRLPDSLHASILLIAAREDRSIGYVVRQALEQYVMDYMKSNLSRLDPESDENRGAQGASSIWGGSE